MYLGRPFLCIFRDLPFNKNPAYILLLIRAINASLQWKRLLVDAGCLGSLLQSYEY